MSCNTVRLPGGGFAIVCTRGRSKPKRKYIAGAYDSTGELIRSFTVEADTQEQALQVAADTFPKAATVKVGQMQKQVLL